MVAPHDADGDADGIAVPQAEDVVPVEDYWVPVIEGLLQMNGDAAFAAMQEWSPPVPPVPDPNPEPAQCALVRPDDPEPPSCALVLPDAPPVPLAPVPLLPVPLVSRRGRGQQQNAWMDIVLPHGIGNLHWSATAEKINAHCALGDDPHGAHMAGRNL